MTKIVSLWLSACMTFFCRRRHDNHVGNFSNIPQSCVCSISLDIPIPWLLHSGEIYHLAHEVNHPDFLRNIPSTRTTEKKYSLSLTTTWVFFFFFFESVWARLSCTKLLRFFWHCCYIVINHPWCRLYQFFRKLTNGSWFDFLFHTGR